MRSSIHGTFATLLLLVPVVAIPALAIFGIPQFAPVVASPLREGHERDRERGVGDSARPPADDLFGDIEDFPSRRDGEEPPQGRLGDSVPLRSRNSASASMSGGHDVNERRVEASGRLPSWAEDSPVDDRQPPAQAPEPSTLDRFARQNGLAPRDASRLASAGAEQQAIPRNFTTNERRDGEIRLAAAEGFDARGSQSYQRQRDTALNREVQPSRTEVPTETLTWAEAVRRLNQLEIRNFRLEPGHQPSQFVFICSYTPSDSPRVSYRFEAEADEPLKAVAKVLEQIDEWQQRR